MEKILMVGEDSHLLATRAAIVEKTGAHVTCCSSSEFTAQLSENHFGLVVLCHSIRADAGCEVVKETNQQSPGTRVLKIMAFDGKVLPECGCRTDGVTTAEPDKLLAQVNGLLVSSN